MFGREERLLPKSLLTTYTHVLRCGTRYLEGQCNHPRKDASHDLLHTHYHFSSQLYFVSLDDEASEVQKHEFVLLHHITSINATQFV